MDQFPGKLYPILDLNSQSKLHENHTLHSGTFTYSPHGSTPTPTFTPGLLFTLFTKTCSLPPPHTYSCKRSLKFLLGITVIPREIKDNSYQAKFWGVNKVHCGQHEKSEKPTKCILSRSLLSFLVLVKIIFRLNLFNLQSATKLLKHCT